MEFKVKTWLLILFLKFYFIVIFGGEDSQVFSTGCASNLRNSPIIRSDCYQIWETLFPMPAHVIKDVQNKIEIGLNFNELNNEKNKTT